MILPVFVVVLVQPLLAQKYEGDVCTDANTNSLGICCAFDTCSSAQEELRKRKRQPTLCSFVGLMPVVCCRDGCGDGGGGGGETAVTSPAQLTAVRKSEMMCTAYSRPRPIFERPPMQFTQHSRPVYRRQTSESQSRNSGFGINISDSGGSGSIAAVGGQDAKLFEFPHMAALGWTKKFGGFAFNCGGTLISDRFVLTAGHCLVNERDTTLASSDPSIVRLGDQNILDSIIDGAAPLDVPIERVIRHKDYNPPVKYNDIALIQLKTVVSFTDHMKPACLWTKTGFDEHKKAIVTGWGTTVSGSRENSAVLQKVEVDILDTPVCQRLLQSFQNRNWRGFVDHQLCAGVLTGGKDACQGDSGGPLQFKGPSGNYHVIGVTSFGRECGKPNMPGVYTRVSAFLDWIESVVWPTGE